MGTEERECLGAAEHMSTDGLRRPRLGTVATNIAYRFTSFHPFISHHDAWHRHSYYYHFTEGETEGRKGYVIMSGHTAVVRGRTGI